MRKKYTGLFVVMVIFLISIGCATPAGRSAGEVVDDGAITTEVKIHISSKTDRYGKA